MLGLPNSGVPQWNSNWAGSWIVSFAVHRADQANLVRQPAGVGKQFRKLDAALPIAHRNLPDWPSPCPECRQWRSSSLSPAIPGIGWPCSAAILGFGSNRSRCDGPPTMKIRMTFFAFGAKCGCGRVRPTLAGQQMPQRHRAEAVAAAGKKITSRQTGGQNGRIHGVIPA